MNLKSQARSVLLWLFSPWRSGWCGAVWIVLVTLLLFFSQAQVWLEDLSFDVASVFGDSPDTNQVILVLMDTASANELGAPLDDIWPRKLHAVFLERLTEDRASLVVFDAFLDKDKGEEKDNERLARAMEANGRVVIGAIDETTNTQGLQGRDAVVPHPALTNSAAGWGIFNVDSTPAERVTRTLSAGTAVNPSLAWKAAEVVDAEVTRQGNRLTDRWMNYYGGESVRHIAYKDATATAPGFFRGLQVFIGGQHKPAPTGVTEQHRLAWNDEYRTPFTRWRDSVIRGVEIHALSFLNLVQRNWITRLPDATQVGSLLLLAVVFGWGMHRLRPWQVVAVSIGTAIAIFLISIALFVMAHLLFTWTIPIFVQLPMAVAIALVAGVRRHYLEPRLAGTMPAASPARKEAPGTASRESEAVTVTDRPARPVVPDHEMLRCIGHGGYGEVWLARNAVGLFHAVKIVYRDRFQTAAPFDREFRGIRNFMPVSLGHPNLVHLLHVGQGPQDAFFYYIMEAGDDAVFGQKIAPESYSPQTLSGLIRRHKKLPPEECLRIFVGLASALDYLHSRRLVHRDIKPANIIFVNTQPKLADIGLVAEMAEGNDPVTYLGTAGYIPPEGPGSPAADVFSLGKVMLEARSGRDRSKPLETEPAETSEVPTQLTTALDMIISKSCAHDVRIRYSGGGELHAALVALQRRFG